MTSSQIKCAACLFMMIDHTGAILYPELDWPRVVGRMAFPLFAWLLATGWRHTSSRVAYLFRLFVFALLSQMPYILAFQPVAWRWNVFFNLAAGLLSLLLYEGLPHKLAWVGVAGIALLAECLRFDHGAYGVLMIFCFGLYAEGFREMALAQILLLGLRQVIVYALAYSGELSLHEWWVWAQPASLAAMLFIHLYDGRRGMRAKYLFYFFYPMHLLVLSAAKWL